MTVLRTYLAVCAGVAGLCASAMPTLVVAADRPPLVPSIQVAEDLSTTHAAYVVTNATPLFRSPAYGTDNTTGETLQRGAHPQILGEANTGLYLLIGRGGQGVGYAPRSLLCPVNLCADVKGAPASP